MKRMIASATVNSAGDLHRFLKRCFEEAHAIRKQGVHPDELLFAEEVSLMCCVETLSDGSEVFNLEVL